MILSTFRILLTQTLQVHLKSRKQENDLPSRVQIITTRNENGDGFTSILTIWNQTIFDEGYYTCRSINRNKEQISTYLYIFIGKKKC